MIFRRAWISLVAAALVLPAVVDCFASQPTNGQRMHCCDESNCAPGHQTRTCVSSTVPTDAAQSVPEVRASVIAPFTSASSQQIANDSNSTAATLIQLANAIKGSPPNLYSLHLVLLI